MATYTENYNLTMPEAEDYYNVEDYNENFETLDALMAEAEAETEKISDRIGTPAEDGQTLFSLLNNSSSEGVSVIKSIQHVTSAVTKSATSTKISINTVDPTKCFVLFERLYDDNNLGYEFTYTLSAKNITCTHSNISNWDATFGFWIIEFY